MSKHDDNTPPEYTQDEIPQSNVVDISKKHAYPHNGDRAPVNMDLFDEWEFLPGKTQEASITNAAFLDFNARHAIGTWDETAYIIKLKNTPDEDYPRIIKQEVVTFRESDISLPEFHATVPVIERGKFKYMRVYEVWKRFPGKTRFTKSAFIAKPGMYVGDETITPNKDGVFNLFRGYSVVPKPGNCEPVEDHIYLFATKEDEKIYDYIINWAAFVVQFPGKITGTALVLMSGQGAGKNIVTDMLLRILASNSCSVSSGEELTGRFNAQYRNKAFVVGDEISNDQGKGALSGKLKVYISQRTISTEEKYGKRIDTPNHMKMVLTSNKQRAISIDHDDRRFCTVEFSNEMRKNHKYFNELSDHIYNKGGLEAFMDMLLKRDISNFDPREIPYTMSISHLETKVQEAESIDQWLVEIANNTVLYFEPKIDMPENTPAIDLLEGWRDGPIDIVTVEAFEAYEEFCKRRKLDALSSTGFKAVLTSKERPYGVRYDRQKIISRSHKSERRPVYSFPALDILRKGLDERFEEPFPWSD